MAIDVLFSAERFKNHMTLEMFAVDDMDGVARWLSIHLTKDGKHFEDLEEAYQEALKLSMEVAEKLINKVVFLMEAHRAMQEGCDG